MQRIFWILLSGGLLLGSCTSSTKAPDVSHLQVTAPLSRFDQAFFALDTTRLTQGLDSLARNYAAFYPEFMQYILGVSGDFTDTTTQRVVR